MIFARDLREEAEVAGVAGGLAVHQVSSTIGGGRGFGLMQSYKVVEWEAAPPL